VKALNTSQQSEQLCRAISEEACHRWDYEAAVLEKQLLA